jgi:predicted transcriptional regulator
MRKTILRAMDTAPRPGDSTQAGRPETEAETQRRLAWEAEMIAEADAEIDAGLYVDAADIDTWINSIGTDHELPLPPTRHR